MGLSFSVAKRFSSSTSDSNATLHKYASEFVIIVVVQEAEAESNPSEHHIRHQSHTWPSASRYFIFDVLCNSGTPMKSMINSSSTVDQVHVQSASSSVAGLGTCWSAAVTTDQSLVNDRSVYQVWILVPAMIPASYHIRYYSMSLVSVSAFAFGVQICNSIATVLQVLYWRTWRLYAYRIPICHNTIVTVWSDSPFLCYSSQESMVRYEKMRKLTMIISRLSLHCWNTKSWMWTSYVSMVALPFSWHQYVDIAYYELLKSEKGGFECLSYGWSTLQKATYHLTISICFVSSWNTAKLILHRHDEQVGMMTPLTCCAWMFGGERYLYELLKCDGVGCECRKQQRWYNPHGGMPTTIVRDLAWHETEVRHGVETIWTMMFIQQAFFLAH